MSGLPPKHGLLVTVSSGPPPPHGNPACSTAVQQNSAPAAPHHRHDSDPFTRAETISIRLPDRKPRPFAVFALLHTPDAILIEFVEISIFEENEPVCKIPLSTESVLLEKQGDSHVFRPTDRQFAEISEHLECGRTVKVVVHYLAGQQSELKIGVIDQQSHHKLGYFLLIIGLGCAVQAFTKHIPARRSAPPT